MYNSKPVLPERPTVEGWYEVQWEPGDESMRVYLLAGSESWGVDKTMIRNQLNLMLAHR